MSYYSELKPYEEHLERWKRTKAWGRTYAQEIKNEIINIYERNEQPDPKVNRSCPSCVGTALDRAANYFLAEKEKFAQRRRGKTKNKEQ